MSIISVRIDSELKKKMDQLKYINWSQKIRNFLEQQVEIELKERKVDLSIRKKAIDLSESIKQKYQVDNSWNSTEELRKWREYRK